ncbi:unnamed protein product [Colletotrichum noveboracense]|uniref:Uncharacterized protein n=1 Tax=Colletotrichum noveboracense TaxID=2664923 RepID=A0A9W4WMT3_9PEZI|nr:unnamed protein product [Colletotrichum noveboracense]
MKQNLGQQRRPRGSESHRPRPRDRGKRPSPPSGCTRRSSQRRHDVRQNGISNRAGNPPRGRFEIIAGSRLN